MNKSLNEALDQLEKFGATNLRYINREHPNEQKIFGLNFIHGSSLIAMTLRAVLSKSISKILVFIVPYLAPSIANAMIHYSVLTRMYVGWKSTLKT